MFKCLIPALSWSFQAELPDDAVQLLQTRILRSKPDNCWLEDGRNACYCWTGGCEEGKSCCIGNTDDNLASPGGITFSGAGSKVERIACRAAGNHWCTDTNNLYCGDGPETHVQSKCPAWSLQPITISDKKKCVVKGDPHIKRWETPESEGAKMGLYGTYADYWLVNTPELKVMGRIGSVKKLEMGVVKGIAVSGSLVGDKILEVPTENNGPITFDGTPITTFPWEGGGMKITVGKGPNLNLYGSSKAGKLRSNTYTVTMDKAEIMFNQDVFQHLQIEVDSSLAAADSGLCGQECKNWFECQEPICDLTKSLFSTDHPECGNEVDRRPCNPLRKKLAKTDCNAKFGIDAHGTAVQNCIEDCCADRDQCPDRGKGDGMATCLVFGDPHIKGFDAQLSDKSSYNPMGTHWLVNSKFLQIQANYATEPKLKIKAQINGVAITGALVGDALAGRGHPMLYFHPPSEGGVSLDGKKIMDCRFVGECVRLKKPLFYEDPNGHYNITFGKGGDITLLLTDLRPVAQRDNTYTVEFAIGAKFLIHQGSGQSMYMSINSDILKDVSGECGNFNGNPNDDGHPAGPSRWDSSALCATASDIFLPNGKECDKMIASDFKCTTQKELTPFRLQCMKHFDMKQLKQVKLDPEAANILKECQVDCCMGGTCPGTEGVSDYEPFGK